MKGDGALLPSRLAVPETYGSQRPRLPLAPAVRPGTGSAWDV